VSRNRPSVAIMATQQIGRTAIAGQAQIVVLHPAKPIRIGTVENKGSAADVHRLVRKMKISYSVRLHGATINLDMVRGAGVKV